MATNEEIVAAAQQLYVSYYGRPADPEGLAFWIDAFTASDNVDQVLIDFGTSEEYTNEYGDLTTPELITALYQQMFNRDPDAEGLAFYTDLLDSGEASLASIALDIANGATGDDVTILSNKVIVANAFTADVAAKSASYQASDIAGAKALLAAVDETDASVTAGIAAADTFTDSLPVIGAGGEFTIGEDSEVFNASAFTSAVTVILDGDSDEANFDVTLSAFDDTVILEEYKTAAIKDSGGIDVLDTSEHSGTATVNLLAGTFRMLDGTETFKGTISGVENVIGTDNSDIITGDNGDNWIWSGEGSDTVKGGIGDDTFVYEDEAELAVSGTVDGQTDEDTIIFTADSVDLTGIVDAHVAVETLQLTNTDLEDEVTLVLDADGGGSLGVDNFDAIIGSDAIDTIQVTGNVDLSGATLTDIEVVATTGAADITTISSTTTGLTLANVNAAKTGVLQLAGTTSATFDLTSVGLSGFESISGRTSTTAFDTVVLTQDILDEVLANATAGTGESVVFANLANATTKGADTLQLSGNVDFTDFATDSNVAVAALAFGSANTVLFNDFSSTRIATVTGSTGTADVLVINTGAAGTAQDLTPKSITDVETLLIDVESANATAGVDVTLDEKSLSGVETVTGEINLIINTSAATESVNLAGVTVTEGVSLASVAATDLVVVSQEGIDGFGTLGTTANQFVSLVLGDTSLDLSEASVKGGVGNAIALSVTGTAGDDTVVGETTATFTAAASATAGRLFVGGTAAYSLGAGNDSFSGAASTLDVGGGSNTVNGQIFSTLSLTDGKAATTTTDGSNLVTGLVTGAITGGNGNDTLIGLFPNANALGAGNDSVTGNGGAALTLGAGNDSFASLSPTLHLTLSTQVGGFTGNSVVSGGSGNDTLSTQIAGDSLTGGTGNDVFTVSAKTFSPIFVGTTTTTLATTTATTTIGTGSTANAITGGGVTLVDYNVGAKDTLNIDLVGLDGTYTTGTALTTTNSQALSGTTTVTTALAAARTASGGLRVVNRLGEKVTIALGEAIGTTVAIPVYTGVGSTPTTTLTGTSATALNSVPFLSWIYNTNVGGTGNGGIKAALANTTFVVFAMQTAATNGNFVAYLVTANSANTGTIATGEVSIITMANLIGTDGFGGADVILI